jgi:hypothetical protein
LRPAQNNYLLDGIDNNVQLVDFLNGTHFVVRPPVDAIAEFKIQTNSFSAEFGRSAGAVLNATIKSGQSSPGPTTFMERSGNSSETTSLMLLISLKMRAV